MKRNDLLPILRMQMLNPDGTPANLAGVPVVFNMSSIAGVPKIIRAPATVVDANLGWVEYAWVVGDTDTSDTFLAEFRADYSGLPLTYPNSSYERIVILPNLDDPIP